MRSLLVLVVWVFGALSGVAQAAVDGVDARAYLLVDDATGVVLAEQRADARRSVASLTKMMTAYVALRDAPDLDASFVVPASAVAIGESGVGLRVGERLPLRTLLEALLVPSANDAAQTIAVGVGGSRAAFVARMNAAARELRMRRTHYVTTHGLDAPRQFSTARDQLLLARAVLDEPIVSELIRQSSFALHGQTFPATDTLVGAYAGFAGGKTGHTDEAGWCLVGSATRGDVRLWAIVLGAADERSRDASMARLLDYGFRQYHVRELVADGASVTRVAVTGGSLPAVDLVAADAITTLVAPGRPLRLVVRAPASIAAPVRRGAAIATVEAIAGDTPVGRIDLVATADVPARGLADRLRDRLRRLRDHLP